MGKRLAWIDIAKGIAILFVIIGHCLVGYRVNDAIFSFHIPIFFIIAGYTFRDKPVMAHLWKNVKRILIPYAITCLCVVAGRAASAYIQGWEPSVIRLLVNNTLEGAAYGFGVDNAKGFETIWSIGAAWYLLAYFWATSIYNIIMRLTKNKSEKFRLVVIVTCTLIGWLIGRFIWLPTNIDIGMFAVSYMYIGHLLRDRGTIETKIPKLYLIPMLVLWGATIYYGGVNMVIRFYPQFVLAFAGSVCGSIIVMRFSNLISVSGLFRKVFGWCGRNSLTILCVHLFEIFVIPWDQVALLFDMLYNPLVLIQFRIIFCVVVVAVLNWLVRSVKAVSFKKATYTS